MPGIRLVATGSSRKPETEAGAIIIIDEKEVSDVRVCSSTLLVAARVTSSNNFDPKSLSSSMEGDPAACGGENSANTLSLLAVPALGEGRTSRLDEDGEDVEKNSGCIGLAVRKEAGVEASR
jgi:hypothetical protein